MQQRNKLVSIFMLSFLLIMMNNKIVNNTSNSFQFNKIITSVIKIEKEKNEDVNIENNKNKFFLYFKKERRQEIKLFFCKLIFTFDKLNGRNNLKYLE
ncbi:hypothetical protein STFE110948_01425 [Streptobacillus felis]|uniref:Uncharacterized protein n=1 Tax=Streptobacillus felis TaxID=1384509 RepID=A0A7Z0TAP2_9FUSO|nr:hypothetical protein [Streptobacillus felis]NYV28220.1 hypothetical protein [Streptobacillus felis]